MNEGLIYLALGVFLLATSQLGARYVIKMNNLLSPIKLGTKASRLYTALSVIVGLVFSAAGLIRFLPG